MLLLQLMMVTAAAVVGLNSGKRLLSSSFYSSELPERLFCTTDQYHQPASASTRYVTVTAKKNSSNYGPNFQSSRQIDPIKAVKEHTDRVSAPTAETWSPIEEEEEEEKEISMEALLLLQKSMLEKQWMLPFDQTESSTGVDVNKVAITSSGIPARLRRTMNARRKSLSQTPTKMPAAGTKKVIEVITISPDLLQSHSKGYVRGVTSEVLLTHAEVVQLSQKIKAGLVLEERRSRLKERLGCEPTDEQLAVSMRMTRKELQSKLIECNLAREKLAMSNVRLVMSIAQRYENMGADMSDLVQGGLIGLLRGIEKFDSSKGFRISTYVYWWIRQGVSRALVENSRTLRLPTHLHERLNLIRNAKHRLEEKGITPTLDQIAERLNMSHKKIRNATEAIKPVFSFDREAFPSLNGLPGETFHSYIADNSVENNPWHGVDEWALKDEVNRLMDKTLREREKEIIRLYYGLDNECLTWEDISKRFGLSRERVRQVGLVALEKLKHAARKKRLEAMLVKHQVLSFFCGNSYFMEVVEAAYCT